MLDLKALLTKILERLDKPKYYASTSKSITTGDIDTKVAGASVTLPAGRSYLVIGSWTFNTRTTTGTTNSQVEIWNGSSVVASQRMMAGANNYNVMQCMYVTNVLGGDLTYTVRGSSSRPTTSAQPNWIIGIAI